MRAGEAHALVRELGFDTIQEIEEGYISRKVDPDRKIALKFQ